MGEDENVLVAIVFGFVAERSVEGCGDDERGAGDGHERGHCLGDGHVKGLFLAFYAAGDEAAAKHLRNTKCQSSVQVESHLVRSYQ